MECSKRESIEEVGQKKSTCSMLPFIHLLGIEQVNPQGQKDNQWLPRERGQRNYKGDKETFAECTWSLSWLWWWIHRSIHMSKQTKSGNFYYEAPLYVSCTSMKLFSVQPLKWIPLLRFYLYIFKPLSKWEEAFLFLHHLGDLCWQRRNKKETAWKPMT